METPEVQMGNIGSKWIKHKLTQEVDIYGGLTYSPNDVVNNGTLVLRSSNIQDNELAFDDNVYVSPLIVNCSNVQVGDIVTVVRNGSRSLLGKHAIIQKEMPNTVIGAFMSGIRCKDKSSAKFINALLSSRKFYEEINKNLGATINQITIGTFNSMEFMFPSNAEKKLIGSFFDNIDSMISTSSKKLMSLKQIKSACLQSMFPQEGESVPKVRFKGFEDKWKKTPLKSFAHKCIKKNTNREYDETFTNSAELGVISQKDYFDYSISNEDSINGYYIIEPDDFVYNPRISTSAPVGPINRNLLNRAGIMSPLYFIFSVTGIDKSYLSYFFKTNLWHKFMFLNGNTGARFDRLSITDEMFLEMPICTPPSLEEQQKIAAYFENLDKQISLQTQRLEKLKQIKSACLDKMFV